MAITKTTKLCDGCYYATLLPTDDGYKRWYCLNRGEFYVYPGKGCVEKMHKENG